MSLSLSLIHDLSDAIIAISFVTIAFGLIWYVRHRDGLLREYQVIAWLFCGFIFAAGLSHLLGLIAANYPIRELHIAVHAATALLAAATVIVIWPVLAKLAALPSSRELAGINVRLRREAQSHEATLRELEQSRRDLETRVEERTGELKAGERHQRDLVRELTHRSKNLLAVVQAMARQTARQTVSIEVFLEQFAARLQALSSSHDLLVQEGWRGASLSELIRSQLGHYIDRDDAQVSVDGPTLLFKPEAAQSLTLAFHELVANAAKYGCLSIPTGRVSVEWRVVPLGDGNGIEILWAESGGPHVAQPSKRGFGTLVIERNLARALEAEVKLEFPPQGARCSMRIPAANLAA